MSGEWQPIETAPRDGTPILIFDPLRHVRIARWGDTFLASRIDGRSQPIFGFVVVDTQFVKADPTHWMPLPDPPKP